MAMQCKKNSQQIFDRWMIVKADLLFFLLLETAQEGSNSFNGCNGANRLVLTANYTLLQLAINNK